MRGLTLALWLLSAGLVLAQGPAPLDSSSQTISYSQFIDQVSRNHPISRKADLYPRQGKMRVRAARGGFDPKAYGYYDEKDFKTSDYWERTEVGLKLPTWYGLEFKGAWEQTGGTFLNPEATTPTEGLGVVGVSWDVGAGLLLDERRAALRDAQLFEGITETQRILLLNELLLMATEDYWEWVLSYYRVNQVSRSLVLARERYEAVKLGYRVGEYSAMDTLDTYVQFRNFEFLQAEAGLGLLSARYQLNTHLWGDGGEPLWLSDSLRPAESDTADLTAPNSGGIDAMVTDLNGTHPKMAALRLKGEQLVVERRLKAEQFRPEFKLNYNLLSTGFQTESAEYSTNNFKWGFTASFPLLLRKARGGVGESKVKIAQNRYDQDATLAELEAKLRAADQAQRILYEQVELYTEVEVGYARLLRLEELKFFLGESELFKVNSRELKLLEVRLKRLELLAKYRKAQAKVLAAQARLQEVGYEE